MYLFQALCQALEITAERWLDLQLLRVFSIKFFVPICTLNTYFWFLVLQH